MPHYNVVVLGAGPGGYVAAVRAAQLGQSVAIIEEKYWGGVCLNVGCIPSKALLKNAEVVHTLKHKADFFGISGEFTADFGAAFDRSRVVADGRVKGIHYLMKKNKVTEYEGRGQFTGPKAITVTVGDAATTDEPTAAPTTAAPTAEQTAAPEVTSAPSTDADDSAGTSAAIWIVSIVAVLVVAGVVVWIVMSRRRGTTPTDSDPSSER